MPDSTLAGLTAATAATGGLYYGTQGGADRKFTITAAGAAIAEAADAAAQRTAMGAAGTAANTFTGAQTVSVNGAASTPPISLTGTIFTGGSATTTKPALLVEPEGTISTGWNTSGTMIGANAPTGFTGRLFSAQLNGVETTSITSTGKILCALGYASAAASVAIGDANGGISFSSGGTFFNSGGNSIASITAGSGLVLTSNREIGFAAGAADAGPPDAYFVRSAASILGILGASAGGGALEVTEMTTPAAPSANKARIYAEDNGSGKTRLMVRFPSGAAQQIAVEP